MKEVSDKVLRILRAYEDLTEQEKLDFLNSINTQNLSESAGRMKKAYNLGPLSSGACPYCGK